MWMGLLTYILQATPVDPIHASKVAVTIVKSVNKQQLCCIPFMFFKLIWPEGWDCSMSIKIFVRTRQVTQQVGSVCHKKTF